MTIKRPFSGRIRLAAAAGLLASVAGCALLLLAQDRGPDAYTQFPLRHVAAADVRDKIADVLDQAGIPHEIAIDRQNNQLLVRGPQQAYQITQQIVNTLDRPAAPAAQPPAGPPPVAMGYPIGNLPAEETLEELRARFPAESGARIAPDERTQQWIVVAPEPVQRQVAALLAAKRNGPPVPATQASGGYQLRSISWRELEDQLAQVWQGKLSKSTDRAGEVATLQLALRSGTQAVMQVDRRHNTVTFLGSPRDAELWLSVVQALDRPLETTEQQTKVVPIDRADPRQIEQAVQMVRSASQITEADESSQPGVPGQALPGDAGQVVPGGEGMPGDAGDTAAALEEGGLIGPVQIQYIEGLDVIILRGNQRDVDRVRAIISDIERFSTDTQPSIEILPLKHVGSQVMSDLVSSIYDEILSARQGQVTITPLVKPNSLLMIGRPESVNIVKELIDKLDQPVEPAAEFEVFQLKYISALDAQETIEEFYVDGLGQAQQGPGAQGSPRPGLGARVNVVADYRSNSLIVHASPRDLVEIRRMVAKIDVESAASKKEVRIFRLKNALATDVAPVLQDALNWQLSGNRQPLGTSASGIFGGGAQFGGQTEETARLRSAILTFMTVDSEGHKVLESGLLSDVRVTADTNGNSLVITAPEKSMALIAALVEQLDTLPSARAQIKVFTIVNGDATALAQMLQQLLSTQSQTAQGGNTLFGQGTLSPFLQPALQSAAGLGESTLVPVRFGVDQRTNSIIVTGSEGDLGVVEAVLLRLDEADFQQRKTTVYWLANAPATEVAAAVDEWLADRDAIYDEQLNISPLSPDIILNREVIVVPEAVSNSIIISATPEWFDEVSHVVQALDRRLPLVKIDMLIVEVELNDEFEFGAEFGLQDSLLYDRAYSNGDLPGYNFNNEPLGDRDGNRGNVLGQALSAFNLLRESTQLGYGGLVLSASRDSVSVLIRALQEDSRAQILSRPHITTLDSQPASVFVGTLTARPGETVLNANQAVTSINEFNVGLELGVTPRVTPDGLVIMEVDVTKSRISEDSVEIDGNVIQNINTLETFTTIAARSGQTVVFTGLIDTTEVTQVRGIPYLSRLPVVGPLFSFTRDVDNRTELLIIMTPHVIQCDEEVDWFVFSESERMSWCASDVMELYGELQITSRPGEWCKPDCCETPVIFPDMNPMGLCANPAYPTGAEPIPGRPQGLLLPPPTAEPGVSPPLAEPEPDDQAGAPVPRAARLSPQTSQPLRPPATFSERPAGYQPAWEGANTAPAPVGPPPVGPPPAGGYDAANAALWAGEHAAPHGVVPSANVEPSRTAPPEAYLRRFPQAN